MKKNRCPTHLAIVKNDEKLTAYPRLTNNKVDIWLSPEENF